MASKTTNDGSVGVTHPEMEEHRVRGVAIGVGALGVCPALIVRVPLGGQEELQLGDSGVVPPGSEVLDRKR